MPKLHKHNPINKFICLLCGIWLFQEEGEAVGKWRRACLTSNQLSTYYVGNLETNDIRKSYEAKHGADVNLKSMHDQMLAYGSPPPKYVKRMLDL